MSEIFIKQSADTLGRIEELIKSINGRMDTSAEMLTGGVEGKMKSEKEKQSTEEISVTSEFLDKITTLSEKITKGDIKTDNFETFSVKFSEMIGKIGKSFQEFDVQGTSEKIASLESVASNSLKFGLKMALATPLLILSLPGTLALGAVTATLGFVANKFFDEKHEGNFERMAVGIQKLGVGVAIFALGMTGASILLASRYGEVTLTLLTVAGAATVFSILGRQARHINKGSLAMVGIAASTALFAYSMAKSAEAFPSAESTLLILGSVAGTAIVFGLAGKLMKHILFGSLAIAATGFATQVVAKGFKIFAEDVKLQENSDLIWKVPALIGGLGLAFTLAGAGPVPLMIGAGALAIAGIGGALWVVAKGVGEFAKVNFTKSDADTMRYAIQATVEGFANSFKNVSLKDALTLPLKIPVIAGMGVALAKLSEGIKEWKRNSDGWKEQDSELLKHTIFGMSQAFAVAGSPDGMSKLFGFSVGSNNVERGIDSTMRMGKNLTRLAKGITAWKKMDITEDDLETIKNNITKVLNVIPGVFAVIGERERGSDTKTYSLFGMEFKSPFSKGDIELGISATRKLGDTLTSLSEGVLAWVKGGEKGITEESIQSAATNIKGILAVIPEAFAAVGKKDRESEGFFPWSDGDVTRGVEIISDLSESFGSISDFVKDFSSVENPDQTSKTIIDIAGATGILSEAMGKWEKRLDAIVEYRDPMKELVETFSDLNEHMEDHVEYMKDMPKSSIEAFSIWGSTLRDLASIDVDKLKKGANVSLQTGASAFDFGEKFNDSRSKREKRDIVEKTLESVPKEKLDRIKKDEEIRQMMNVMMNAIGQQMQVMQAQLSALRAIDSTLNGTITVKETNI